MDTFYKDKIVSIIGGNSGIGAELSRQLAAAGATVIIGGRNAQTGQALVTELTDRGLAASFLVVDVQQPEACKDFFDTVVQQHGRLDFAFNSAGIIMGGEIRDNDIEDIQNVLQTNVLGTTFCSYYAYQIMVTQGSGHIVNLSSGAGLFPTPIMGVYSSSKFAITGLSEVLRIEAKALGVKVSTVTPGIVDTPIYTSAVYSNTDRDKAGELVKNKSYVIGSDIAVHKILKGVQRNKAIIHTQGYIRRTWWAYRFTPGLYRMVTAKLMPQFRKRFRNST